MSYLTPETTKHFHETLYAGQLQSLTLYKRGDDQSQGTVVTHKLFDCRRGKITRSGQTIQGRMTSNSRLTWHIPGYQLQRLNIDYLSALDKLYDALTDSWWQPEADTTILNKLWDNHVCVDCRQCDPPGG